jgi:excisionase family DNA binding protein
MPRPKPTADRRTRTAAKPDEVLTLAEAAAYLRVTEPAVLRLVREQALPGRKVEGEWRFLKAALADWLARPAAAGGQFWSTHFGALQDDPNLDDMLAAIYRRRGRPETAAP